MKTIIWILIILLVLTAGGAIALFSVYNDMLEPVNPDAPESFRLVEIPQGANTEAIGELLFNEGLIQNKLAFRFYVRQRNLGQGFIAGLYNLSPTMDMEEIIAKIQSGEVYSETVWFTIPEGFTVEQIAARLDEAGLVSMESFLAICRNPSPGLLESFSFLKEVENPDIEFLLEGYLFPDTYEVYSNATEEDIISIMLNRLELILHELDYSSRMPSLNLSLHELLTIAALIEREARVDHERSTVASVIYNRLAIGMRLQIDATIQYILEEPKEFLLYADLEIPSPYNTYLNNGLPPGPIAAPGKESIDAALNPDSTDYFYYNYKYDGTGEHYFSRTLEEHNQNVTRAEANLP
ncbi:MAG: endolytic transglycosylase MltG [Firmicutes bacterium]|nr:endolytic transglycosylase MltG [Bacillota bacterium]